MVERGSAYVPVILKGLSVHSENPLLFDFIVDTGDSGLKPNTSDDPAIKEESNKLVKYFLASLTITEKDQWVNLSPYEKDRILPEELGKTELGRDMLAQDYLLKQITASMIHPDKELGREFWNRIYERAQKEFGVTDIPVDTFNKVWITAEKADVYVNKNTAFVVGSHLKVMLESDYVAQQEAGSKKQEGDASSVQLPAASSQELSKQLIREIILPELEREVNTSKNFANLRQIFHSMILATWYKKNLKSSLLTQVYADQGKTNGVEGLWVSEKGAEVDPQQIWAKYEEAYKKGVFNFIKEDVNQATGEVVPRKYFSGGLAEMAMAHVVSTLPAQSAITAGDFFDLTVKMTDPAMSQVRSAAIMGERQWANEISRTARHKDLLELTVAINQSGLPSDSVGRLRGIIEARANEIDSAMTAEQLSRELIDWIDEARNNAIAMKAVFRVRLREGDKYGKVIFTREFSRNTSSQFALEYLLKLPELSGLDAKAYSYRLINGNDLNYSYSGNDLIIVRSESAMANQMSAFDDFNTSGWFREFSLQNKSKWISKVTSHFSSSKQFKGKEDIVNLLKQYTDSSVVYLSHSIDPLDGTRDRVSDRARIYTTVKKALEWIESGRFPLGKEAVAIDLGSGYGIALYIDAAMAEKVNGTAVDMAMDAVGALKDAYARGETDEFVKPEVRVGRDGNPVGRIQKGDVIFTFNFRRDRTNQLTAALASKSIAAPVHPLDLQLTQVKMMMDENQADGELVVFPPKFIPNTLANVMAKDGRRQFHVAETEKYNHVTRFFDGGFSFDPEQGEDRVIVSSPNVETYDLQPEMSAQGVTDKLIEAIKKDAHGFYVVNFANPDMVGHTGNMEATIKAIVQLDKNLGQVLAEAQDKGLNVLITADHGNAEQMVDPKTGEPQTKHSTNPVPLVFIPSKNAKKVGDPKLLTKSGDRSAGLSDVAPTVLKTLGIAQPAEMTGVNLIEGYDFPGEQKTLLIILDGWGVNPNQEDPSDAIRVASERNLTPSVDRIWKENLNIAIQASGEAVGLPKGQMGNSEVGHIIIGAGRIIEDQPLVRVNDAIKDGSYFKNEALLQAMTKAKETGKAFHMVGMVSDGGVHSSMDHIEASLKMAKEQGLSKVYLHVILDGRDTAKVSAEAYLEELQAMIDKYGVGEIVDIAGRYYSMDRDYKWDRTAVAYQLYVDGTASGEWQEAGDAAMRDPAYVIKRKDGLLKVISNPSNADQGVAKAIKEWANFGDSLFEKEKQERTALFISVINRDEYGSLSKVAALDGVKLEGFTGGEMSSNSRFTWGEILPAIEKASRNNDIAVRAAAKRAAVRFSQTLKDPALNRERLKNIIDRKEINADLAMKATIVENTVAGVQGLVTEIGRLTQDPKQIAAGLRAVAVFMEKGYQDQDKALENFKNILDAGVDPVIMEDVAKRMIAGGTATAQEAHQDVKQAIEAGETPTSLEPASALEQRAQDILIKKGFKSELADRFISALKTQFGEYDNEVASEAIVVTAQRIARERRTLSVYHVVLPVSSGFIALVAAVASSSGDTKIAVGSTLLAAGLGIAELVNLRNTYSLRNEMKQFADSAMVNWKSVETVGEREHSVAEVVKAIVGMQKGLHNTFSVSDEGNKAEFKVELGASLPVARVLFLNEFGVAMSNIGKGIHPRVDEDAESGIFTFTASDPNAVKNEFIRWMDLRMNKVLQSAKKDRAMAGRNIILVVDDYRVTLNYWATQLQHFYPGAIIIKADNGNEAIDLLEKMPSKERARLAAVVASDRMFKGDGFEVAKYVAEKLPNKVKYVVKGEAISHNLKVTYKEMIWKKSKRDVHFLDVLYTSKKELAEMKLVDLAMADVAVNGGIDLNAGNMSLTQGGDAVEFTFDPVVVEQFRKGDFTGITPVILNITPIPSLAPLLGMEAGADGLAGLSV